MGLFGPQILHLSKGESTRVTVVQVFLGTRRCGRGRRPVLVRVLLELTDERTHQCCRDFVGPAIQGGAAD
jgi:hypothetical protein